ncbi:hypothetical protein JCM10449v2_001680 [Rhodotorula kratochvilovae]
MVLQDKYARAASRKYQRTHAPTAEQSAEHAAVDAAIHEAESRRLGSNADRYRADDEERERALERRKAEEQEQLDAFLAAQRDKLASSATAPVVGADDEDEDDIDHSFAHLRIGGKGRAVGAGAKARVETEEEKEELRRMQDNARRMQAVRDLKDRFSGSAVRSGPPPSLRPPPSSTSASSSSGAPTKPIVQPAKQGQDFLDLLL